MSEIADNSFSSSEPTPNVPASIATPEPVAAPMPEPVKEPPLTVAVVGEILFSGSEVVRALLSAGCNVRLLCPNPAATAAVRAIPAAPDVSLVLIQGGMEFESAIRETLTGAFAVIYLSPITLEGRGDRPRTHLEDCKRLIAASEASSIRKLIYHSALGAHPKAASRTLREAAEAELLFQNSRLEDFFLRTGPLMGRGDHFLAEYIQAAKKPSPFMSILGYGSTMLQPLHIKDFAACLVKIVQKSSKELAPGAYYLAGPETTTVLDLHDLALAKAGRFKFKFHVPLFVLKILTAFQKGSAFEERVNLLYETYFAEANDITKFIDAKQPLKTIEQTQAELGSA